MKRVLVSTAVLLSGVLLSSCGLTGLDTLEEKVEKYNTSINEMQKNYKEVYPELEEDKEKLIDLVLYGKNKDILEENVDIAPLETNQVEDFKAYIVMSNNFYTTTNYNGVTQGITLVGYKTHMLIEAVWLEGKVVFLEYTLKGL